MPQYDGPMRWLLLILSMGCARYDATYDVTLPADGVFDGFLDADRGDLSYDGFGPERSFEVQVTSWARGSSRSRAERREAHNRFGASVDGEWLDVWGRSGVGRSGTDLAVSGPYVFNVEAITPRGTVRLSNVDGFHTVTASRVEGVGVWGDVDALADGDGIDLEIYPYDGSIVRLETVGDGLTVALPWGLDYDLQVFADPEFGYEVEDLGFQDLVLGPDYALGTTRTRSIRVTLLATGGVITVREAR